MQHPSLLTTCFSFMETVDPPSRPGIPKKSTHKAEILRPHPRQNDAPFPGSQSWGNKSHQAWRLRWWHHHCAPPLGGLIQQSAFRVVTITSAVRVSVLCPWVFRIRFLRVLSSFRHGVRGGHRGEDGVFVGGAEEGRDPEEEAAHEFRRQVEQNRGLRQKWVRQQWYAVSFQQN